MSSKIHIALAIGCGLAASVGLLAQQPAQPEQKPAQTQQPAPTQKPPTAANPFPEDTTSVPVVPTSGEPAAAPPSAPSGESAGSTSLLKNDSDPVHSPDDPAPDSSADSGFSSSLTGANDVNIPDDVKPGKHGKAGAPNGVIHQETAKEDEDVGAFELSRKNWRAARSRFQSALVTDPENPDVYWGLAEAQRQLGDFASSKANYQKVVDYEDPESKHSREAKRLLKTPQLANAPAVSKNQSQPQ
ncbi:MAG TPA: tetratricopeptide repeat protein [Terracidiphilus sp.]|jgi:tetratricopeptide (TPR) repeat protein